MFIVVFTLDPPALLTSPGHPDKGMFKHQCFERFGVLTGLLLGFFLFISAAAQSQITVIHNQLNITIPERAIFSLAAESQAEIQKATLIYNLSQLTCQEGAARRLLDFEPAKEVLLDWELDFQLDGVLLPGQDLGWQWEIQDAESNLLLTEPLTVTVQDQRHQWQTIERWPVKVQWYEGNRVFGQHIADTAFRGLERLQRDLGVTYQRPIRITVYPDTDELRSVLVESVEWVGAVAYPEHGLILMAASADDSEWIGEVIPHELSHLVMVALTFNCQGGIVPTWLEEGMAERTQGEVPQERMESVLAALEADSLPPLKTLEGSFSHYGDEAVLSYNQSHMVVTYMVDTFGPEKLADLLAAVQSGLEIDKALNAVYGFNTAGLDRAWRESLGYKATEPVSAGATPTRTTIPTIALWTPVVQSSPTAAPSPSPTIPPLPSPASLPVPTVAALAQATNAPPTVIAPPASESSKTTGPCATGLIILLPLALLGVRQVRNRLSLPPGGEK